MPKVFLGIEINIFPCVFEGDIIRALNNQQLDIDLIYGH